jgi:pimeloyl-ACP methyl ester carboxylesterase
MKTQYFKRPESTLAVEGTLAYDDSGGDGALVLMEPGMGDLRGEYRFLAPAVIEAGYRVVTADLRGHGESSSNWSEYTLPAAGEDILALIDHLDAGPAHFIGTSFTPGAAVWAEVERPEVFRSLTLIGPWLRDADAGFVQNAMTAVLMNGPWKVRGWGMFYKSLYPTRKPDDFDAYMEQLLTNLREPGRFDALKGLGFGPKTASEERVDRVQAPALVVMGTKDADWPDPEAEANWIVDQLSAELLLVEDAGHYPHAEMPEKVTPVIVAFLNKVDAVAAMNE